jgi:hypothetical protein
MTRALFANAVGLAMITLAASARASAIANIAPEIAKGIAGVPKHAIVVVAPLISDLQTTRGDELALRVASQIATKIDADVRPHTATLAAARALASRGPALVFVQVEIAHGKIRVTADVYSALANSWDRVRSPAPPPRAHAFAESAIDAEVRTFLPPIPLEQARVHKAKHDEGDVLAVACGDVDGDGGIEIVLVSRARVAVGRIKGNAFVPFAVAKWSAISARAAAPLREPIAGVQIEPNSGLFVGMSDRLPFALMADLKPAAALRGIPVAASGANECALVDTDDGAFARSPIECQGSAEHFESPVARVDAFAEFDVITTEGATFPIVAAHDANGKLFLVWHGAKQTIDGTGAQVAIGDLDQDGAPEIVTSSDRSNDAISIATWTASGLKPRLLIPAPLGVHALAICPPELKGAPALVGVVGNEVWLVR